MAGLLVCSISDVTAKVHLSQSFVLANISLEDTQVRHGAGNQAVGDLSYFNLTQATQAQAASQR